MPFMKVVREIAEETGFKAKDVGFILYFFLEKTATHVADDGEFSLPKFGKFVKQERNVHSVDGTMMKTQTVRFLPGQRLKDYMKRKASDAETKR